MPGMHVRVVNSYDAASEKMPGEAEAEAEAEGQGGGEGHG